MKNFFKFRSQPETDEEKKKREDKETKIWIYGAGIALGLISILFLYITFSEGFFADDFLFSLLTAIISGLLSFICFSPWKRINSLIGGTLMFATGVWMFLGLFNFQYDDFWLHLIWTITFLLVGVSLILRFFNTTLFKSIHKIIQNKAIRLTAKIIFWLSLIIIGLLVIAGLFSLIAGLSATSIIIILLVLIWLK